MVCYHRWTHTSCSVTWCWHYVEVQYDWRVTAGVHVHTYTLYTVPWLRMLPQPICTLRGGYTVHEHGACHFVSLYADWLGRISEGSLTYRPRPIRDQDSFSCVEWILIHVCSASDAHWSGRISKGSLLYPPEPTAKQDCFAAKNEEMFIYRLCKQNYPSVIEEGHCSIDCEKVRNDQKSLSYRRKWDEDWPPVIARSTCVAVYSKQPLTWSSCAGSPVSWL